MIIFSRPIIPVLFRKCPNPNNIRSVSEKRQFLVTPSRWQWTKCKDLFHFYASLGVLCAGSIVLLSNVFIGPATLEPLPEHRRPKHWEYYQHPITRFIARHMGMNPQQEYEKFMHYIYEEDERVRLRQLEKKIRQRMMRENDYQAWYYTPATAKYLRVSKETADHLASLRGD